MSLAPADGDEVTVCVIFRNEESNLPVLLQSIEQNILKEDPALKCSFLFVDNDSLDKSVEIIHSWIKQQSRGTLIQRNENHLALARNQALEASQAPWVAFVDADTCLQKCWWQELQKAIAEASPETNIIGGGSEYQGSELWHTYARSLDAYFPMGKNQERQTFVDHVSTNNCLMRREAVLAMGGFHKFYKRVGEDLDLTVRASRSGLIAYQPTFKVNHRLPDKVSDWYFKMTLYGRAQSFVFLRNRGGIPLVKFIPTLCLLAWLLLLLVKPSLAVVILALFFVSSRLRFYFLSFLFYGLGELMGLLLYFPQKHKNSLNQFASTVWIA